jgi:hypothetical protein
LPLLHKGQKKGADPVPLRQRDGDTSPTRAQGQVFALAFIAQRKKVGYFFIQTIVCINHCGKSDWPGA